MTASRTWPILGTHRACGLLMFMVIPLLPREGASEGAPVDAFTTEELAPLTLHPLPGETAAGQEIPVREAVDALLGRAVVRVTSPDAPPGFDPVTDANIPLGLEFSRILVRKAVHRLWETGRYRDVAVRVRAVHGEGVELIIAVDPMLRIGRIRVEGNNALSDDEVEDAMECAPGQTIVPEPEVLRAIRKKLLGVYAKKGYRAAGATLSIVTTEEPGTVVLVGNIEEGEPERYTVIEAPGLPEEITLGGILKKGMIRDRERVEATVRDLQSALSKAGYLDAELLPVEEVRIDKYRLALRIPVDAKLRSEIRIEGNRHFLSQRLLEVINADGLMQTGSESVRQRIQTLKKFYRTHGFFFVDVRVIRRCLIPGEVPRPLPLDRQCASKTEAQHLVLAIREGPYVGVAEIRAEGNEWFTNRDIQEELFAFVSERNASDEVFQPVAPKTLDRMGLSDKRPDENGSTRVIGAPRYRRARVYVPEQYAQGMSHLVGLYQEQGFLAATVRDTCDIETEPPVTFNGEKFVPLLVARDVEGAPEAEGKRPCVFVNRDRDLLLLRIQVDEGVQTTIQEIAFEGNRVLPSKDLQRITRLSIASPYNEYRLREAARKLTERYRDMGYMFVDITWERRFSEDMHRAKIVYSVNEGPQTRVGMIRIEGAETTSKRLIKERLTLQPGDLITPEELEKSQNRLMEIGIFNGATVQMVSPETPAERKNLRVQVSEAKPQYLEFRWGVATVEGLRTGLEYGFNNIGGYALTTRFRARANYRLFFVGNPEFQERYEAMKLVDQLEHHVLIGIGSPHLPGTRGLLGWGIDAVKERLNKPGFSADRFTTFLKLNTPLAIGAKYPHGFIVEARTGFEYNIEILQGLSNNPFLMKYLRLPYGKSAFYVVGLSVSLDLRDSPFNPTEGFFLSVGGDWVKSLPVGRNKRRVPGDPVPVDQESNLLRTHLTASGYITVFDTDLVVALSFSIGYIFHLKSDSTTWPDRFFYVGGIDTLRGFPEDSLVPQDLYDKWKANLDSYGEDIDKLLDTTGGQTMLVTRAELRYPLAKGFYGAGFAELGNVWREQKKMHPITLRPIKLKLRPVAGAGIRYLTPLGPVSFDVGVNLRRRPREDPFSWYLSIGTAF